MVLGRVVAGVGEAEAHVERGRGQRQQHPRGDDRRGPWPPLDGMAPARGGRIARRSASSDRPRNGIRSRSTRVPELGEQRGEQRDRREHHHQHGDDAEMATPYM